MDMFNTVDGPAPDPTDDMELIARVTSRLFPDSIAIMVFTEVDAPDGGAVFGLHYINRAADTDEEQELLAEKIKVTVNAWAKQNITTDPGTVNIHDIVDQVSASFNKKEEQGEGEVGLSLAEAPTED